MNTPHPCATRHFAPEIKERLAVLSRANLDALYGAGGIGAASDSDGTVERLTSTYYDVLDAVCPPGADKTAALRCVRLARWSLVDAVALTGFGGDASAILELAISQIALAHCNAREAVTNCEPSALPPLPTT
jgi:hypothetical protein